MVKEEPCSPEDGSRKFEKTHRKKCTDLGIGSSKWDEDNASRKEVTVMVEICHTKDDRATNRTIRIRIIKA